MERREKSVSPRSLASSMVLAEMEGVGAGSREEGTRVAVVVPSGEPESNRFRTGCPQGPEVTLTARLAREAIERRGPG